MTFGLLLISAAPAHACPDVAAALGLGAGDTVDHEACAGRFVVAQVTRGGDYEEDRLLLDGAGAIVARDTDTSLAAAYHDLENPQAIATLDGALVYSAHYDHEDGGSDQLLVWKVDGATLVLAKELPLGDGDTCEAKWKVRGHAIVITGHVGRHADRRACPKRGTHRYSLR